VKTAEKRSQEKDDFREKTRKMKNLQKYNFYFCFGFVFVILCVDRKNDQTAKRRGAGGLQLQKQKWKIKK